MTSLLLIPLLLLSADEPKWELSTENTGVKIYGRKRSSQTTHLTPTTPNLWLLFNAVRELCPRVVKAQTRADRYLR